MPGSRRAPVFAQSCGVGPRHAARTTADSNAMTRTANPLRSRRTRRPFPCPNSSFHLVTKDRPKEGQDEGYKQVANLHRRLASRIRLTYDIAKDPGAVHLGEYTR